ncbi:MAG: hypothetical protein GY953_14450, partial [bacterium]|nr:hypothetical protein [bacterium]
QERTIDTDVYKVTFSNKGAVVQSWILKEYSDGAGGPLALVDGADHLGDDSLPQAAKDSVKSMREQVGYPFSLDFAGDQAPAFDPNVQLFVATETSGGKGIDFEYSDGATVVRKSFLFNGGYRVEFSSEVVRGSGTVPHQVVWRGGFGDSRVANAPTTLQSLYYDPVADDLETLDAGDAEEGPVGVSGRYSFAGIEDSYFAAVAIPDNGSSFDLTTFADTAAVGPEATEQPHTGVAFGGR